ncbi:MAG: YkgJ family cysteine cluster protein [Candidatus Omnitrophica bacterium]|nr:YkgJ family cysteine cluster protein [Candidatus Omnitrophota bacterium]
MLQGMKQLVPSKVCLSCEGCCRFSEAKSEWRPRIMEEEKVGVAKPELVEKIFLKGSVDEKKMISTIPFGERHICRFLTPQSNACGIYHGRPFECQLYPFLLMRKEPGVAVAVHLSCPYVQDAFGSSVMDEYIEYLKEFFQQKEVLSFVRRNKELVVDYSNCLGEIEELFSLPPVD